jgi:carbon-monoxide dehydrogenase medium subunit
MILGSFEYHRPSSLDGALSLMARHGGGARPLAGGTDLVPRLKDGLEEPRAVIDLKGIAELARVEERGGALFVGACATFSDLLASKAVRERWPLLWEAARSVGSLGIRNRATLVGNICSAVPSLDSGPALLVHEAEVLVEGPSGPRSVPVTDWFKGPRRTALASGELVVGLSVPRVAGRHGGCYARLGRYAGEDLAQVGVAALALEGRRYRVAFCAVGPVAARARRIEALLDGRALAPALLAEAAALVAEETSPITDVRASKEYRAHAAKVLLARALRTAVARLGRNGPPYGERVV